MKYSKELKIGVFVIVVLCATFFIVNYLRGRDLFGNENDYIAYYDNIQTLTASAPVMVKGYQAGAVSHIEYLPETGNFKVVCSVDKDFAVPVDSKITLYSTSIMGGKGIEIVLGESQEIAEDGAVLASDSAADMLTVLGENIGPLLEGIDSLMDSLSVTVSGVNRLLGDSNQKYLSSILKNLDKTVKEAEKIVAAVDSDKIGDFVNDLTALSDQISPIIVKLDSAMTGLDSVAGELAESDIKGLVDSVNSLLKQIQDPDGTLGKILNDGAVYDSVEELINDVTSLVNAIKEKPKKYIKISVF